MLPKKKPSLKDKIGYAGEIPKDEIKVGKTKTQKVKKVK